MRYTALTAILLAATAVVATPAQQVERGVDYYDNAAETTCTDADVPVVTKFAEEYVTVTAPAVVKTKTIRRKKTRYGAVKTKTYGWTSTYVWTPEPTPKATSTYAVYEPEPTYEAEPTYEPEPTSAAPTPTGAPVEAGSYAEQCLQAHNTRRAAHGAPALVWDEELANWAQGVSGTCVFEHSGGPYGENLAYGGDGSPEDFVKRWYDEVSGGEDHSTPSYSYSSGGFSPETGHFTQVIWKGTTRLGCATVNCPGMGNYFTCEYADAGNVQGQYQDNVLPPV